MKLPLFNKVVIIISLLVVMCSCSSSKHTTTSQRVQTMRSVDSLSSIARADVNINQLQQAIVRIETITYNPDTVTIKEKKVVTIDYSNKVEETTTTQEQTTQKSVTTDTIQATSTEIKTKESNIKSSTNRLFLAFIIIVFIVYYIKVKV
jgi:hypothetical protein